MSLEGRVGQLETAADESGIVDGVKMADVWALLSDWDLDQWLDLLETTTDEERQGWLDDPSTADPRFPGMVERWGAAVLQLKSEANDG